MEFDKSRVYTSVNADELKVGSKIIVADSLKDLQCRVEEENWVADILESVYSSLEKDRFKVKESQVGFNLAYLISEPEEKKLKWTDLKIGDVIRNGEFYEMITSIHQNKDICTHIYVRCGGWISDEELKNWEKVDPRHRTYPTVSD